MIRSPRVLVTGASRGIGYELCRQLAARGAAVGAASRGTHSEETASDAVVRIVCDVTNDKDVATLGERVKDALGGLDVLVNNAAIGGPGDGPATEVDVAVVRTLMETNLLGALRVIQATLPLLRASECARIVNVSSARGSFARANGGGFGYRASKGSLNLLTANLAAELSPHGIAVNAVCPGWTRTRMGGPDAERSVEQSAEGLLWLCLDAPQGLTGHFLRDREEIPW